MTGMIERPSLSLSLSLVFFFVDPFKLPAATDPSNVLISRLPRPNFAEFAPTRSPSLRVSICSSQKVNG